MRKNKKKDIKIRKKWEIDPTTRIHPDQTKEYNRSKARLEWEQELEEELLDGDDFYGLYDEL